MKMKPEVSSVVVTILCTWHYGGCETFITDNYKVNKETSFTSDVVKMEYMYPNYSEYPDDPDVTEVYENHDLLEFNKLLEEHFQLANSVNERKLNGITEMPVSSSEPYILTSSGDETDEPLTEDNQALSTPPTSDFNNNHPVQDKQISTTEITNVDSSSGSTVNVNITSKSDLYEDDSSKLTTPLSSAKDRMVEVEKRLSASTSSQPHGKSHGNRKTWDGNTNEIHNFLSEIEQQTPLIALACIISSMILTILVYIAFRFMTKLNQTTNVSLIRHSEYPDVLPSNQQYQVQKLLIKQQVQEEKVQQQRQMKAEVDKHKGSSKRVKNLQELKQVSGIHSLSVQNVENLGNRNDFGQINESTTTIEINPTNSSMEMSCSGDSNRDRPVETDCMKSGGRQKEKCTKRGNEDRFGCIDIIIENGNCLECIEAMQKRSSEELEKNNSCATITYHLGDGVCNDENHFGSLMTYRDFTEISLQ